MTVDSKDTHKNFLTLEMSAPATTAMRNQYLLKAPQNSLSKLILQKHQSRIVTTTSSVKSTEKSKTSVANTFERLSTASLLQ